MSDTADATEETVSVEFLGIGGGDLKSVRLDVLHWAEFPRGADGTCAFCHGDPCAENGDKDALISRLFAENTWVQTCPVCDGRAT
jgi:hypothetical protein